MDNTNISHDRSVRTCASTNLSFVLFLSSCRVDHSSPLLPSIADYHLLVVTVHLRELKKRQTALYPVQRNNRPLQAPFPALKQDQPLQYLPHPQPCCPSHQQNKKTH